MSAFLIRIQLHNGTDGDYRLLGIAMAKENFIPGVVANQVANQFAYFGNSNLAFVNNAVETAAQSTGIPFTFSVVKNGAAEKQFHTCCEGHFYL